MTRINLVYVKDLADQHLFAEWREIKMIVPSAVRSLKAHSPIGVMKSIPNTYVLGTGHVTFFYNKLLFLRERFNELTDEVLQRGFDITPFDFETNDYKFVFSTLEQIEWQPTNKDIQLNIDRITQRLNERPNWYRYYGDIYSPDFFIDRYNQRLLVDTIAV